MIGLHGPLRRIREARRKAAETDSIMDERIAAIQVVYAELFATLLRTQDEIRVHISDSVIDLREEMLERQRREGLNNGT